MLRRMQVTYCTTQKGLVPMIRLRGKWLQAAGFTYGTQLSVLVEDGRITLTATSHRAVSTPEVRSPYPAADDNAAEQQPASPT